MCVEDKRPTEEPKDNLDFWKGFSSISSARKKKASTYLTRFLFSW